MDAVTLRQTARAWAEQDPDPTTRDAVLGWLATDDREALTDAFRETLGFGTGGMRGPMGPGTTRMNRAMVRRVTAAVCEVLDARVDDARERGVVVAWDARRNSRVFAEDTARVLAAAGFRVHLAPRALPTPILSFATVALGAAAGIIVTASHNPPADNGYKLFWTDGAQIVSPTDVEVQEALGALEATPEPPALEALADLVRPWPDDLLDRYHAAVQALRVHPEAHGACFVYTPVHGVGREPVLRALSEAGHDDVHVVAEQSEPDGAFPTVPFPNPEEAGVLDLAEALGTAVGADAILANDPDADRLAVAVPTDEGWRILTGNQVGVLLAEDLLAHRTRPSPDDLVATTIVSSAMLARVARAHDVRYGETLTGFKWIADLKRREEARGAHFVFGFEESIGYTAGDVVHDKDGVSAAMLLADLVSWEKARGRTLLDAWADLCVAHGLHATTQRSVRLPGQEGRARIDGAMAALRETPPTTLAGRAVVRVRDVLSGEARDRDGTISVLELPSSDVLGFDLEDGSRALVRPSGTEPKLKLYVEIVEAVDAPEALSRAEARAQAAQAVAIDELLVRAGLD